MLPFTLYQNQVGLSLLHKLSIIHVENNLYKYYYLDEKFDTIVNLVYHVLSYQVIHGDVKYRLFTLTIKERARHWSKYLHLTPLDPWRNY